MTRVDCVGVRSIVGAAGQSAGDWFMSMANERRAEVSWAASQRGSARGGRRGQQGGRGGIALQVEDGLGDDRMQLKHAMRALRERIYLPINQIQIHKMRARVLPAHYANAIALEIVALGCYSFTLLM